MKIFLSKQVTEIDKYTISNEPILSIDLMERAATKITDWIFKKFDTDSNFIFFVGPGNNGGDALVVARNLAEMQFDVSVYIIGISNKLSPDAEINLERLKKQNKTKIYFTDKIKNIQKTNNKTVVVDGLFGSGLTRPLTGLAAEIVKFINIQNTVVVSIDSPSGLFGENNSNNSTNSIVKANYTLALQFPNISFMFPENEQFVGKFIILPIGLHKDAIESTASNYYYVKKSDISKETVYRKRFSHKGNFGHALLISGSYGKMGAAVLSSEACLRTGAGLLTVHVPKCGNNILQTAIPEAMLIFDNNDFVLSSVTDIENYNAIGIGPGLGQDILTKKAFVKLIKKVKCPLVIDADGINILATNKELLNKLPENTIITPHLKEFERLFGKFDNSYLRNIAQIKFSKKYNLTIVLKGANTSTTTPNGKCYFNSTGNAGMATAGSGDVLTGIILSLLAQGYIAEKAAIIGVYLHGLSADIAVKKIGEEALIASDISRNLGLAYKSIKE